jgi:hypothetical protein
VTTWLRIELQAARISVHFTVRRARIHHGRTVFSPRQLHVFRASFVMVDLLQSKKLFEFHHAILHVYRVSMVF